jgi:hypothetical protein
MRQRFVGAAWITIALVLGLAMAATIFDWLWQGHLVKRAISTVQTNFPLGTPFAQALTQVQGTYPRYTESTADTCSKEAAITTPSYSPQGGPCISGITKTGSTWWGFESAVTFRLMFGPDQNLRQLQVSPVYTFL